MSRQFICSNCGKTVTSINFNSEAPLARLMRVESLCFDCAFWKDYITNPQPDTTIISGKLYAFHPIEQKPNRSQMKRKGIVFARNMQTGAIVSCTDYRYIANIPDTFKPQLPDHYRFISAETYSLIAERAIPECLAKGCWDRYHCFWYNTTKAEPHKPWNQIPHYHKPGDEQCESFINKDPMYHLK